MTGVGPRGTAVTVAGEAGGSSGMALERGDLRILCSSPRRVTDVPGSKLTTVAAEAAQE